MTITGNVHRVSVDLSKPLAQEPQTGHNRWHPAIPPIVRAAPGDRVILQTRDALDGQITPASTAEDVGRERVRSEEHTSELQSRPHLVCRLLLEKKKKKNNVKQTT